MVPFHKVSPLPSLLLPLCFTSRKHPLGHQYLNYLPTQAYLAVSLKQVEDTYHSGFLELKAETSQIGARVESLESNHTETASALQLIQTRRNQQDHRIEELLW